ncbi:Chromosome partition protein Smc [Chlamydiales bacterium STE3]|nr:Chromosome partition protein Smc [Chlamydiales bacterium STE3]
MKLKKVEIFGFKSFADKITLNFHDGITCIVGPNGCGKSNIADAMRWVFGEQSAKSMRGDKMVDVIFAGSTSRKSLNLAEVTITFNEINGALPLEYDEVAVTRRLHRNGESDYFINRQPVRLKDIQDIFLDTGIGRTAFSIFEQGKIDQIIRYSPIGRRVLFEEAAGVTRYLQRKKETLRKFEVIDQNLSRVKDIFYEVEKQIVKLEEQAKKAKIFQSNKESLEKLEKSYLCAQNTHLIEKCQEIEVQKQAALVKLQTLQEKHLKDSTEYKQARVTLNELEKESLSLSEEVQLKLSEQKVKREKEKLNKEQLKELKGRQEDYQKELASLEMKKKGWLEEIQNCEAKQKAFESEIKTASEEFSSKEKLLKALEVDLNKLREKQVKSHQDKLQHLQQENQVTQDLKTVRIRAENHQERMNQFEERIQKLTLHIKELENIEVQKKEAFQQILKENERLKLGLLQLEQQIKVLTEEIDACYPYIDSSKKLLQEGLARRNALLRLKEENEGFSAGSKKILKESATPGSSLFGLVKGLYEYFVAESGYEHDLAIVLKRYSETIVVEKKSHLETLLTYAEQKKINDFSVVCVEALHSQKIPSSLGSFAKKVAENPLSQHFLSPIIINERVEQALLSNRDGLESLTEEKYFVDRFQVIHVRPSQDNSIFVREAEIKELLIKTKKQEHLIEELEKKLKLCKEKKSTIQEERLKLDKAIRSNEIHLVEANFSLQKTQGEKEKTFKEIEQVKQEIEMASQSLVSLNKQQLELEKKLLEVRQRAERLISADSSIEQSLAQKLEERKESLSEVEKKRKNLGFLHDENRKNLHALSLLAVKKQESEGSSKRFAEEILKLQLREKQIHESEEQFKLNELEIEGILKEKQEMHQLVLNKIKEQKEASHRLEAKNEEFLKEIKASEKNVHHFEVQFAQAKTAQEGIQKSIQERFEDQAVPEPLQMSFEAAEREMKTLRAHLDQAKDINLSAIEDFEKSTVRYRFLDEQIQDLTASKKELEEAILALDSETRELFEKTFLAIRENFKKNFGLLFNGGEADLELVESKDVLEAGVEIIAKPPGKQMRSLSLLSGGEKCLTAMALLFSIFEVKAAPFCILDEIDAPLDDSNIERFVAVVKQFIDRCQFIIISHNKQTMAIADRLFGVSMQEKGVSKLLSIDFDREKEKAPELVEVV